MACMTTRPRRWWTKDEDKILRDEANKQLAQGAIKDWNRIAVRLRGRTNKDCRKRFSKVSESLRKGVWTTAENQRLLDAVEQYGLRWTLVAEVVGSRHADQCAKRWQNFLDPTIEHRRWTDVDDEQLQTAVETYGRSWTVIRETSFQGRSVTDIKNRYTKLERDRQKAASTSDSPVLSDLSQYPSPASNHIESTSSPGNLSDPSGDAASFALQNAVSTVFSVSKTHSLPLDSNTQFDFTTDTGFLASPDSTFLPSPFGQPSTTEQVPSLDFDASWSSDWAIDPSIFDSSTPSFHAWEVDSPSPDSDSSDNSGPTVATTSCSTVSNIATSVPQNEGSPPAISDGDSEGRKVTLILEDVPPETLAHIVNTLFRSKTQVKMRVLGQ